MKITVCIIIYNRFSNLEKWIKCWSVCNKENAELVVIHNINTPEDSELYRDLCHKNHIKYYSRENIGMDIGAFQDVCYNRIEGFPEWEYLLWITDDVIPMSKSFIKDYRNQINEKNVICMEISREVKTHIRTTGFLIHNKLAKQLKFVADPITNKSHCYLFEHRSPNAFYEQVYKLGGKVRQITPDTSKSPLWDTHNRAKFKRWEEHYKQFPE